MQINFTKRKRIFSLLIVFFLFALTVLADEFTVKADRIETDTKNKVIYLYGNCIIEGKNLKLKADKIKIDKGKGVITASGNVEFDKNNVKGKGKRFVYYTNSEQATIFKGELILESNYRFYAEEITYLSGDKYQLKGCTFTTCPEGCNYWGFYSKRVNVKKEGYATFKSLKFRIKDKSVFYLPFFIYPAKTKRTFGLLIPEFGNSSKHGFNYRQELFIPIGKSQDITLGIDYYSKAGTGATFEYRESFRRGEFARFKVYSIKDRLIDNRRTIGEFSYNYYKSPDNTYQFTGFLGDDYNLIRDYTFNRYDLAMRDFYTYGGFYRKLNSHLALSTSIFLERPLFNHKAYTFSTLPSISLYGENYNLLGRTLNIKLNASFISDDRLDTDTFSRQYLSLSSIKTYNRKWLLIQENLKVKTIHYSTQRLNNHSLIDFSYRFQLPVLAREFSSFTNTITPFVQSGYRDNQGDENILYHDFEDYTNPSGFYLKAGFETEFVFSSKVAYLSFYGERNLSSNKYKDINNPDLTSSYSTVNSYLYLPIAPEIEISSLLKYNPKTSRFDTMTLTTRINSIYLTYFKGYVYGESKPRNSLIAKGEKRIYGNFKMSVQFDYDFSFDDFRYKRISLIYYKKCIGINLTYQNNAYSTITRNQFTLSVVLRSIGELFKYRLGL